MVPLTPLQQKILVAKGHLLVTGGPGSGKTTVAILKAADIATSVLQPGQSVLFLSFARATVARIMEAIDEEKALSRDAKRRIDVDTYHAFFWRVLKTHGYLVGLPRRLELVTPPAEAIALSAIRKEYKAAKNLTDAERTEKHNKEQAERTRLAEKQGRICFSLFATYVAKLLNGSTKVRRIIAESFPVIILDEFQDTSAAQWSVVEALGADVTLIALADPEQRIFEFAGADEKRLQQYQASFAPQVFDLKSDNHRSPGTEIALFGNEVLTGKFTQKAYAGIYFLGFESNSNQAFASVHGQALQAKKRLHESGKKRWSLAILVPTRKLTRLVSDAFRDPQNGMPPIRHNAAVDMEGAILAAEFLAYLLQQEGRGSHNKAIELLCGFFRGRGGDVLTKSNADEADSIDNAFKRCMEKEALGQRAPTKSIFHPIRSTIDLANQIKLTGDPDTDWIAMRRLLEASSCPRLKSLADELRNVRLLDRGTQLRQALTSEWRTYAAYPNALAITQQAFVHEHFASANRAERGVIVMNMHKAKGKQFDEVIIFEGWPRYQKKKLVANIDRIVRYNQLAADMTQPRQNFRVSVTRARMRTTILTPKNDVCVLLRRSSDG